MIELEKNMPAVALRGMTILPGMIAHFDISRERSIKAVEQAMRMEQEIFLVTQKNAEQENPSVEDLYEIGIIASIRQVIKLQNDIVRVLVEGYARARLVSIIEEGDYLEAAIVQLTEIEEEYAPKECEAMVYSLQETFAEFARANGRMGKELVRQVLEITELEKLIDYIANNLPVHYEEKQAILEADTSRDRYETLLALLMREIEVSHIKTEYQRKVKERVDKHQKEYILREQMGLIREELGEKNSDSDADEYLDKVMHLEASDEVKDKIRKEISRMKSLNDSSTESALARSYIETMLELPWDKCSVDNMDLKRAQTILDEDHYGLEKVKERIIEYLAVRNLTGQGEAPILCLVGPPGTGKTSIAMSIAKALEKKYVRICLGGVRDEAEIRGHRRTYVGALPGRIVEGLRDAGTANPLMLLDEIDKVGSDYKGDTSAALLEVLDSEQNRKFRDHYLEIPVNLSNVLFLATANSMQDIPKPLLDRMEILEVSSYTANEKLHIASEFLLDKQRKKNGLKEEELSISEDALQKIILSYTKEAGVRSLERQIGKICRKTARKVYEKQADVVRVTPENLYEFLGQEKYTQEEKNSTDEVGIVRGLAWTSVGGVTLEVEVNLMPGKGECKFTGKMGDVMQESAQTAISCVRAMSLEYAIAEDFFQKHDIHIHIPEGAVPKDGPSAGVTMTTAILSAVTHRPVRADVAMTGEITLRGRVLPIGGLKEKLLAAKNAGIKTVCIPKKNEKDLEEISEEIKEGIHIVGVTHILQILEIALI